MRIFLLLVCVLFGVAACGSDAPKNFVAEGQDLPLEIAEVEEMVDYVAAEMGREWLRPPVIVGQTEQQYSRGLADLAGDVRDGEVMIALSIRRMQAIGQTNIGIEELQRMVADFTTSSSGFLGYYEPTADRVFIPSEVERLDSFRGTLVHELGHALDGQHVDLQALVDERVANATTDISRLTAVLEGRAQALQNRWVSTVGVAPSAEEMAAMGAAAPPLPLAMLLGAQLPYIRGAAFVEALGGPAETWDLYSNPPASSEQFMFPDRFPADLPATLPVPEADGPVLETFEVGALDVVTWLVATGQDIEDAGRAAQGMGGGSGVLWGDDVTTCYRVVMSADTPDDGMELFAAFEVWAAGGEGRTVEIMSERMLITGCAPLVP